MSSVPVTYLLKLYVKHSDKKDVVGGNGPKCETFMMTWFRLSLSGLLIIFSVRAQSAPTVREISVFGRENIGTALSLQGRGSPNPEGALNRVLKDLDPAIAIRSSGGNMLRLLDLSISSQQLEFTIDGFELCRMELKSHATKNGTFAILGKVPDIIVTEEFSRDDWPSLEDSIAVSQSARFENSITEPFLMVSETPCLWVENGSVLPVWDLTLQAGNLHYKAISDDSQVYNFQPLFFHVQGTARIYNTNPVDGTLTDYTISNLIPNSEGVVSVENDRFITVLQSGSQYSYFADLSPPYEFITGVEEDTFKEISLFTNANRALDWFESQGYKNFGEDRIQIVFHAVFGSSDTNNALYQPVTGSPRIFVGDGDGQILQNLALDYDVIAHELGHHVAYHSIKDIQGESLVLHEGIADYFTYAKTGNACLGESICPSTSGICEKPNQCLRTGENAYSLTSTDLPAEAHLRSQFISGFLWDLIVKDGMTAEIVTQLLIKAIDLYTKDTGYANFILGLMLADDSMHNGKYCSLIFDRAVARGLQGEINDYECSKIPGLVQATGGTIEAISGGSDAGSGTTNSRSSKKSSTFCGSISATNSRSLPFLPILLILILPVGLWMRRRTVAPHEDTN